MDMSLPPDPRPDLPVPLRRRWMPLRLGLVELFHYDSEEFWFRDGHLLLRGNNGTGKSKVLSLTLPFLLDANLSPSRVEPDGDRSKRMDWNLLLGGLHERRVGYAWVEFGRLSDDGQPQYRTLGCGLRAVAGRGSVDAWYFLTRARVGADLWLTTAARTVLPKDRLGEALGERGQVYDTATAYRRAVDEALFGLGELRYAALIDTLIQLRQPQLSKQPDERRLSDALTEALPPLDRAILEDVAEAMNQLDDYRRELEEIDAMRRAVQQFGSRYQRYAQTAARRRAAELRAAQTRHDQASRELNRHAEAAAAAETARAAAVQAGADEEARVRDLRTRLTVLRADPVMRDAARLVEAGRDAEEQQRLHAQALLRLQGNAQRAAAEQGALARRRDAAQRAQARRDELRAAAFALARDSGAEATPERWPERLPALRAAADAALARRHAQIVTLRRRLAEVAQCQLRRDQARLQRDALADAHAAAELAAQRTRERRLREAESLLLAAHRWLAGLQALTGLDADALLAELEPWTETLSGAYPLREPADAALRRAEQALAALAAELAQQRRALADERSALEEEGTRLRTGIDSPPPAAPWRQAGAPRPGLPLWRLVDFDAALPPQQRAGVEAALEAAGLLDALVCPDGTLLDADAHDVILLAAPEGALLDGTSGTAHPTLLDVLAPSLPADARVSAPQVAAVLAGVAYGRDDLPQARAWIAPDGRFRVGPARGRHSKPQALHIGHAARQAARLRRLDEIAVRLEQLAQLGAAVDAAEAQRRERADALLHERRALPEEDALRRAEADFAAAERQRREAQTRLGDGDARLAEAERQWQRAGEELRFDAEDLRLPVAAEPLDALERSLHELRHRVGELVHALEQAQAAEAELLQQQEREQAARDDHEAAAAAALEREQRWAEARSVLATLQETVGEAVESLRSRIADAEAAERLHEQALRLAQQALVDASARAAAARQSERDAQTTLDERAAARTDAIDHLRAFAATGLLEAALPQLELPPADAPWGVESALGVARRAEQALAPVEAGDEAWAAIQRAIGNDLTQLQQAMSAQGHAAVAEPGEYGLVVRIVVQQRAERPDRLAAQLAAELAERRSILSAQERDVLERYLQQDIAVNLQRLMRETDERVVRINAELQRRPTSTGMRYRLDWQPLPEDSPEAPAGLGEARTRLLRLSADAWSADDRRVVGEFLHARIQAERAREDERGAGASMFESLARALDYRRWHRFRVQRKTSARDAGGWKPLSGPASSGERALGLTVPLFAAASSHYESAAPHAPRLVLLDEAFAGIDDEARANCMALIREFDLDFVMTSEREWGCYAELPGLSICQIVRREGIDAVFVSRWNWDGRERRRIEDPERRFPQ